MEVGTPTPHSAPSACGRGGPGSCPGPGTSSVGDGLETPKGGVSVGLQRSSGGRDQAQSRGFTRCGADVPVWAAQAQRWRPRAWAHLHLSPRLGNLSLLHTSLRWAAGLSSLRYLIFQVTIWQMATNTHNFLDRSAPCPPGASQARPAVMARRVGRGDCMDLEHPWARTGPWTAPRPPSLPPRGSQWLLLCGFWGSGCWGMAVYSVIRRWPGHPALSQRVAMASREQSPTLTSRG